MIKPIINKKFVLPFIAASSIVLGGCYNDESKIHDYMLKRGDSKIALDSILNATERDSGVKQAAVRQSTIDFMVYRDLFNTTNLAKDSSAIDELNKIAAKTSLENYASFDAFYPAIDHVYETEISKSISIKEAEDLKEKLDDIRPNFRPQHSKRISKLQSFYDSIYYGEFFQKKGLLDNPEFKNKFNEAVKFLKVN